AMQIGQSPRGVSAEPQGLFKSFHPGFRPSESVVPELPAWPYEIPGSAEFSDAGFQAGAPPVAVKGDHILVQGAGSVYVNGTYTRISPTLFKKDDDDVASVRLRYAGAWYFEHARQNKGIYYAVGSRDAVPEKGWYIWATAYSAPGDMPPPT
ncbi:unnamed protein product, partial [Polarella glacialis]